MQESEKNMGAEKKTMCIGKKNTFHRTRHTNTMGLKTMKEEKTSPKLTSNTLRLLLDLPDDLVILILCKLASSSVSPWGFIAVLLTCKQLNELGLHPLVLSKAGLNMLAVKARKWSGYAHQFLENCANAGNVEANYILGMIRFYCLEERESGKVLLEKAAAKRHMRALYALAVIEFNGSGGPKENKDLQGGVQHCKCAANLGHIDALREIGHCYQDGYGVDQNVAHGRQLLYNANFREWQLQCSPLPNCRDGSLESDFGCDVSERDAHPANLFLIEWFKLGSEKMGPGLRLCSYDGCGRPETRPHEFRRCSVCGKEKYCSRGCQALHWKSGHRVECVPPTWAEFVAAHGGGGHEGHMI